MNKPFYSDYIKHAMRFYSRNLKMFDFKCEADKINWKACDEVVKTYTPEQKDILVMVYGGYDTFADNVYFAAKEYGISQKLIWVLIRDFERAVAKRRGLL